jgi:serine protease Do
MWSRTLLIACVTAGLGMGQTPYKPAGSVVASNLGTTSFLGVGIQEIDAERTKTLKLPEEAGVEVTRVATDSPAEKAGIKTGDVILQYNGQRVEGIDQFSRMVRETPAGREAKLGIFRNGSAQTITAKIAAKSGPMLNGQLLLPLPPGQQPLDLRMPDLPRSLMTWRSGALGVEAESLEGQLADFFGVKEGVLVRSVIKGSAAEKAGIKAGDVITTVDNSKVTTPADISNQLRTLRGKTVSVVVVRDRKEVTVSVTLEARNPNPGRIVGQAILSPVFFRSV